MLDFVFHAGGQDAAFTGVCLDLCQLYLGRLQGAIGLVAGPALAPEGPVGQAFDFKLHLGFAFAGVARHDVVAATDGVQPRGLVIKR